MLRKGLTFTMGGKKWRVAYVTPSRAHCVAKVAVTVKGHTFSRRQTIDISPNSGIEVLAELER